jgi:hypothetical protein
MGGAKEPELADLSERHGESCHDRFLSPALRGEIFDGPPEVDGRHRGAHDVFGDGAHVVERIGRFDENRHLLELVGDGALDAAAARDDGEGPVLLRGEERRLNESDRIAVGLEGCVGQAIGGGLSRISLVGVNQGLGIDDAQFDCLVHCLFSWSFWFGRFVRNRDPRERGRGTGAKAAQRAGIRSGPAKRPAEPALCGGRAAVLVGPSRFLISGPCLAEPSGSVAADG